MFKYHGFLMSFFAVMICNNAVIAADDQLKISHKVIASETNGSYSTVSFILTIDNFSAEDLNRVKLSPSSNEFSSFNQNKLINIGYLPAMGQAIVEWKVNTPVDVSYFQSSMPIFYVIKAKHNNGENIEIPVYSSGSAAL